jgi:anhydro-N-acetylmuramic acid kinase
VEHIGFQISKEINSKDNANVLITGGGAFNLFLIKVLQTHTHSKIIIPSKEIVEFKEALIFGFLGVLKLRNEINCLQSVSGANKDHSTGKIFRP